MALYRVGFKRLGRDALLKSLIWSQIAFLWILLPDPPDSRVMCCRKQCTSLYGTEIKIGLVGKHQ